MHLSEKTEKFLNEACLKQFGLTLQQTYNMVEQSEKMKEEQKRLNNKEKKRHWFNRK